MNISLTHESPATLVSDAVVVSRFEDTPLTGPAKEVDDAAGGILSRMIENGDCKSKLAETRTLYAPAGVGAARVVVVGLGKREQFDCGKAFRAAGAASKTLASESRKSVGFYIADNWTNEQIEHGVAGAHVGCVGQDLYRESKNRHPIETMHWSGGDQTTVDAGAVLGESMNITRLVVNEPPCNLYPESFAQHAERIAADAGLEIEIWDKARLQAEKCGALLAVSQASDRDPRLVMLRHNGGPSDQPPIALVGKGVTFDSGGLSLKPSDGMLTMKCDMAGAGTVLGAMNAIAKLKLPINVYGYMGLVENLVSGNSYKLGDVLTARSGKTIEVHNTDAEGRLVLADTLNVALDSQPKHMVDLATLTGACVVALGLDTAGMMTNDQAWCNKLLEAARHCGEPAWQLPMFEEYGELIQGEIADIKNVGKGRWGGAITAAKFLEEFVNDTSWTHIDIAGPAFLEAEKPWVDGGASGAFVRTLVQTVRSLIT